MQVRPQRKPVLPVPTSVRLSFFLRGTVVAPLIFQIFPEQHQRQVMLTPFQQKVPDIVFIPRCRAEAWA